MPPNVKAVIGCKHALIEDFERSLQQRRACPLQNHRTLLRKVGHNLSAAIRERKLNESARPDRGTDATEQARNAERSCIGEKLPP
jgi:hypothetical protein